MSIYKPQAVDRRPYPSTEAECKALVAWVFRQNAWDKTQRGMYIREAGKGFPASIEYCAEAQIFAVLDKLIKWQMVLIEPKTLPVDLNEKIRNAVQQTLFEL